VTAREELAALIGTKLDRIFGTREFGPATQDYTLADELIAAGYRKPRDITEADDLRALTVGSVIKLSQEGETVNIALKTGGNEFGLAGIAKPLSAAVLFRTAVERDGFTLSVIDGGAA